MKTSRRLTLIVGLLFCAAGLRGEVLTPEQAAERINQEVVVEGEVIAASSNGRSVDRTVFLSFGQAYPFQKLTVQYRPAALQDSEKLPLLDKRHVRVRGLVETGVHGPRIVITDLSQIDVLPVDESAVLARSPDTYAERILYSLAWQQIRERHEFAAIEKQAAAFQNVQTRCLNGLFLSDPFHEGLAKTADQSKESIELALKDVDAWTKAYPSSNTAPTIRASLLASLSRLNRGVDNSNVSEAFDSVPFSQRPPWYYWRVLHPDLIGVIDRPRAEALFRECRERYPQYAGVFFTMLARLYFEDPPGEWLTFLERETAGDTPLDQELYARGIWAETIHHRDMFGDGGADWARTKAGFEVILQNTPGSWWNVNSFAKIAASADDKETCGELVDRIGDHWEPEVWVSWSNYQNLFDWLNEPAPPSPR